MNLPKSSLCLYFCFFQLTAAKYSKSDILVRLLKNKMQSTRGNDAVVIVDQTELTRTFQNKGSFHSFHISLFFMYAGGNVQTTPSGQRRKGDQLRRAYVVSGVAQPRLDDILFHVLHITVSVSLVGRNCLA